MNVRLISATHRAPEKAIQEGRLREDLYFRLAAVTLYIEPLRQRRDDVPALIERFRQDLRKKYGRRGPDLEPEAILRLQEAPWPGNVRQLRGVVEKLFVLTTNEKAGVTEMTGALGKAPAPDLGPAGAAFGARDFREARRLFEIEFLARKIRENNGNISRTAEAIGLARQSLQEKIKELGITR